MFCCSSFFYLSISRRDEILTRPVFGNRVQQPHLQGVSKSSEDDDDDDSKDLRPEDLLSLEEEDMDDSDDDLEEVVVPKEEPIDIDDDMDESATE